VSKLSTRSRRRPGRAGDGQEAGLPGTFSLLRVDRSHLERSSTYCERKSGYYWARLKREGRTDAVLDPPGHEDRILAHRARVQADLARLGLADAGAGAQRVSAGRGAPRGVSLARRRLLVRLLSGAGGRLSRRALFRASGLGSECYGGLLRHAWFKLVGCKKHSPAGWVSLTPAGREEAGRLT
jgi:hypothetical protein